MFLETKKMSVATSVFAHLLRKLFLETIGFLSSLGRRVNELRINEHFMTFFIDDLEIIWCLNVGVIITS